MISILSLVWTDPLVTGLKENHYDVGGFLPDKLIIINVRDYITAHGAALYKA